MITGFNTDIEFGGVTYHVQTEDKGLSSPIILSLVYDRGTILASKRLPYDDLLSEKFDERVLAERLQKQHRLMCAAVQAGRIEDLKKMTERERISQKREAVTAQVYAANSGASLPLPDTLLNIDLDLEPPIPRPYADDLTCEPDEPIVEAISIIEDEMVLPDGAVEIVSEMVGIERPVNNKLTVEILGESNFKGGDRRTVSVIVCRGNNQKVIPNAQVMVKIIGSTFRPLIFHSTTDDNGLAKVSLQFPNFASGRAAFLVRAMSDGEEIEVRRPIAHG